MDGDASFGHWITLRRKALRLSRVELARRVGCATVTLYKIEADERRPSQQIAAKLADLLNVAPQERLTFIKVARGELAVNRLALPDQSVDRPALAARARLRTKVPIPPTPLIGRVREVAQVCTMLRTPDARLVTLTGSGGVGKTRLALQAAVELLDDFADGIYIVNLAPITDADLVVSVIAQTLEIREAGGRPLLDQLKDYLHDKQILLLLDNFEQVVVAATVLADLLATCPRLTILVTSREILHLRGEKELPVPPLALPDLERLPPLAALAQYAAVELFIARARDAKHDFVLTDESAAAVAEICYRLDGLPLAIELAAARIKLLAPQALLGQLGDRLKLLTGGARDLPSRQQTLRRTIDWSYQLLDVGEQMLFRRLGVFVGGCSLEAVEAVCSATQEIPGDLPIDALDGLTALVDKSLLRQEAGTDGAPRFVMLETIREYALERLEASGEAERLRRQHARYYLTLGEVKLSEEGLKSPAQLAHLDSDYDNLWAALAWSQTSAGDPEIALRIAVALPSLWYRRGIPGEAIAALERTLNNPRGVGRTAAHAAARAELALYHGLTGHYAAARSQFEQALSLARELGDTERYARVLERLGWLAREQGDSATAWARMTESLAISRELGDAQGAAWTLVSMAEVAILDEDPARAEALLAESRVLEQREQAGPNMAGWTLNHLGHAAQLRGAYDRAAQLHHESIECFQVFGDQPYGFASAYHSLGETALGLGRLDEAARWLAQGLTISQTLSDQASIAWCLAGLGSVVALDEEPERAARLWGAAERQRQAIGCRPAPAARVTYERAMAAAHAQLGEEAFAAAWAEGQAMTMEQAIADALDATSPTPAYSHPPLGDMQNSPNIDRS